MAESSVSSRTFSMVDLEGSRGGGLTRVERSAIVLGSTIRDGLAIEGEGR